MDRGCCLRGDRAFICPLASALLVPTLRVMPHRNQPQGPDPSLPSDVGAAPSPVSRSSAEAHLDEWVAPDIADERGFLRAGKIFEWMDVVGVLAATRHCRRPVVTASVDGMELRAPIRGGGGATFVASAPHRPPGGWGASASRARAAPAGGRARRSVAGHMTFVALDAQGCSVAVPQFRPETAAEVARFREGQLRKEVRARLAAGELGAPRSADLPTPSTALERVIFVRELLNVLPKR